jgi:phosphoenolpyruvate carboxykinase (GTP)
VPYNAQDWRGKPWDPEGGHPAAHPNARFTVSIKQCPSYSSEWEKPEGVPISAMLFGARRQKMIPLVYQSFNWQHGTFLGATLASETTAAATGAVGVVRRDPMAMLPFCGYNMGDYWGHWLAMAKRATHPPKIFRVNWFQRNERGRFLWPGFGENLRILRWITERCKGNGQATETPIGYVPKASSLSGEGIEISKADVDQLVAVDREAWKNNLKSQSDFFDTFGDHLPAGIKEEHKALAGRLNS